MGTSMIIAAIGISAVITFFLRALPFLAFRNGRKMPKRIERLGKDLPSAIMAVLIVYCLKDIGSDYVRIGIPKITAVTVTAASYRWKHNTLLSIFAGTLCYMLMLWI